MTAYNPKRCIYAKCGTKCDKKCGKKCGTECGKKCGTECGAKCGTSLTVFPAFILDAGCLLHFYGHLSLGSID